MSDKPDGFGNWCPDCGLPRGVCDCETRLLPAGEWEDDEPFDEPGEDDDFLWDEELDDDGVYEGDVVIHQPYDDDED